MAAKQKAAAEAKDATVLLCFNTIIAQKLTQEAKILKRAGQSGWWMGAIPNTASLCCLKMQEWRDAFCMQYARMPQDMLVKCYGC